MRKISRVMVEGERDSAPVMFQSATDLNMGLCSLSIKCSQPTALVNFQRVFYSIAGFHQ